MGRFWRSVGHWTGPVQWTGIGTMLFGPMLSFGHINLDWNNWTGLTGLIQSIPVFLTGHSPVPNTESAPFTRKKNVTHY